MLNYIKTTLLLSLFISISLVAGPENNQQSSGWKSWLPASWGSAEIQQRRVEEAALKKEFEKTLKILHEEIKKVETKQQILRLQAAETIARNSLATFGLGYIYSTLNQCQPQTRSLKRSKFLTGYFALYCALQVGSNVLVFKTAHEKIKEIQALQKYIEESQKDEIK